MASIAIQFISSLFLFCLVFGMTATVEVSQMKKQVHNHTALLIGASIQFVILPFIGFITVLLFQLPSEIGITLLVITSSPGGSYSNWWCSMFNADLALSVTMTALSTILATIMLPINLLIYTRWIYSASVIQSLDWTALFISLIVVLSGIISGLFVSQYTTTKVHKNNHTQQQSSTNDSITPPTTTTNLSIKNMHRNANRMGNLAGLALILLSVTVSSSHHDARIWDQDLSFYAACAVPPMVGLILAVSLASHYHLDKPERVAVSVESCYQNTGIATTVALTMFQSESELATAIGVPLFYGIVEAILIFTFCIICWKCGWTKAPPSENICKVIATSYEVERRHDTGHQQETTTIEIVFGNSSDQHATTTSTGHGEKYIDMIFSRQLDDGDYIVDELTLARQHEMEGNTTKTNNTKQPRQPQRMMNVPVSPTFTDSPTVSEVSDETTINDDTDNVDRNTNTIIDQLRKKSRLGGGRKTMSNIRAFATGYRRPLPFLYDDDENDNYIASGTNYQHIVPIPETTTITDRLTPPASSFNSKPNIPDPLSQHIQKSSDMTTTTTTNATTTIAIPITNVSSGIPFVLSTDSATSERQQIMSRRRRTQYESVTTTVPRNDDYGDVAMCKEEQQHHNQSDNQNDNNSINDDNISL